ncbi:MCD domain-containing protein [Durusdinium trenchii]|uniref:MCD domain-containing protein n=2 Tax=Durusdinium trenchii TaxID=1381693 RepID=A0ABP0RJZ7_9DINO
MALRLGFAVRIYLPLQHARRFCAATASEALVAAARHPSKESVRRCVDAISSLDAAEVEAFWGQQAAEEEEIQLNQLASSLPKGGRLVPGLLDHVLPMQAPPTEEVVRVLPAFLGAREGLCTALRWREALVAVTRHQLVGPEARLAAERLERRLHRVLGLWFHEGFLRTYEVTSEASEEVRQAVASIAKGSPSPPKTRCFAISLPQMAEAGTPLPLAALHAEFEGDRTAPRIWAGPSVCGDAFKGLGLERLLLRQSKARLREESNSKELLATLPLHGFRTWLRRTPTAGANFPDEVQALLEASRHFKSSLRFKDLGGDEIFFEVDGALKVQINAEHAKHVQRVRFDSSAMLILLSEGAMQIDLPEDVDIFQLQQLCAFGGLLTPMMREPILNLAFQFLFWPGEGQANNPDVHFHLAGGADFVSLQWRADESSIALADSFGLQATFNYHQDSEEQRADVYKQHGIHTILK